MSVDKVVISAQPGEARIALIERTRLRELVVARPDLQSFVGNIYLGRVERVLAGIQAAFVTIGQERAGFLAASEARPVGDDSGAGIEAYVKEGDTVLVQVQRDPIEDKGAKLTTHLSLAGRYLVMTPGHGEIKISRRIDGAGERARLSGLLESLADDDGFIVRTSAATADEDELRRDIETLRAAWREIKDRLANAKPPARLHRDLDPVHQALREAAGPRLKKVITDCAGTYAAILDFCKVFAPGMADKAELHDGPVDLFESHGVEEQIENALSPRVSLSSGGDIIVSETPALCAIDVNSGAASDNGPYEEMALATNLEAANEIARQVRLRNLSGMIVIDFLPMKRQDSNDRLLAALRNAMNGDATPSFIAGFTRLGLLEMTRPRRRGSLTQVLCRPCPPCSGGGFVKSPLTTAFEALRAAGREGRANAGAALTLRAPACVIEALSGPAAPAFEQLSERLGRPLQLSADATLAADGFRVEPADG